MTTQVLMSSSVTLSETASISGSQTLAVGSQTADAVTVSDISKTHRLPYQANHQVELLHLQAETEALLERLKTLKQQRSEEQAHDDAAVESSVLVSR